MRFPREPLLHEQRELEGSERVGVCQIPLVFEPERQLFCGHEKSSLTTDRKGRIAGQIASGHENTAG